MLRPKVKEELERMERLGVIERIHEPTDWVNSMVTVIKKNGQLQICIDHRDLNKAIKREYYPMKTVEEIAAQMPGAKFFSVLDASSGFWQVKLDEESSKLCTFNTPFGRYMFKRLPFGICSAQDIFQSVMSEIFEDIEGVQVLVDDILVWGTTNEEHDTRLEKVLQRTRLRNLKLNKDKSQIRMKEITYAGHIFSEHGIKPDPKKVQAITNMKEPTNKEEIQRFLGMTTYLSKFIPNYSEISGPLRVLLEKNTEWHWDIQQKRALRQLKHTITNPPLLKYFDPAKPTKISVDASSKGMGAVLLQDDHPIAYSSKSLTSSQQNYAQIEKEMLAIVFGCHKFHDYIYGLTHILVETDHKPLESILKKPLHSAPARLQRMILSIQKYPLHVTYKPGKELLIADTLSRSPLPDLANELEFTNYNINILHTLPITENKLTELKQNTLTDRTLTDLVHTVKNGWPELKQNAPIGAHPFWNYRDEITYHHGILFKGNKVIIPTSMRTAMLKLIHASHLGADRCKRRARDIIFWPGMNAQIEDFINNCSTCSTHKRNNTKEPLLPHSTPDRPWEKVGIDLCEFRGHSYLVMVDYYSNFIEADKITQTTSDQVIELCKSHFARHGIPNVVVSDNGPQFSSFKFHQFSTQYQFQHRTSSPHYPQSNGKVERAVQVIKNLLRKSQTDKQDFHLALLEFHNTPTNDILGSPAQRLMGRRTRTLLPTTHKLLVPKVITPSKVQLELSRQQANQKYYYDKHSHPLTPLKLGDQVNFQKGHRWLPATITANTDSPRSYVITTPNGQIYRRNRRHLRSRPVNYDHLNSDEQESSDSEEERQEREHEQTEEERQEREHEQTEEERQERENEQTEEPEQEHEQTGMGNTNQDDEPSQITEPIGPRRSQRKIARPYTYANPYSLRFPPKGKM
jgi:transposase InsO family protein